jgi:outer membrane receptor protein involved in Fe transport
VTESFNITAGVNNILDRKPPVLGGNSQQASTYPGQFDVLGRDFFIAAKIKL